MSDFKPVYFSEYSFVTSSKLNQMMLNQKYLKDKIESMKKGSLLASQVVITKASGAGDVTLGEYTFTCESSRSLKMSVSFYDLSSTNAGKFYVYIAVDNKEVESGMYVDLSAGARPSYQADCIMYIPEEPLSKGEHSISLHYRVVTEGLSTTLTGLWNVTVEDCGYFTSQTTS